MTDLARDVNEITALIHEYAFRLDAGDLDGVAALFEHGELGSTRHDGRLRGSAEARTNYNNVILYADGTPRTQHQITNVTVKVDGTTATARSSFTVLQLIRSVSNRSSPGTISTASSGPTVGGGSPSGSSILACSAISLTT